VKKAPLILLFLLFIYLPGHGVAAASDLVLYYDSKEIKMFFDKENIATTGDIKRVWIEIKYEPPVKIGNAYASSVLGLLEINCKNKQYRDLKFTAYHTAGGNQTAPGNATWRSIVPDAHNGTEALYRKICVSKEQKKKPKK
jgi:hypothetical protein